MKRILVLLALVISTAPVHAQPVPVTWRPARGSVLGEFLKWSGTAWVPSGIAPGDITSVGATAGGGLTGGSTSGAALLGLLTTCTDGQLLKSTTGSWGCDDDIGITNAASADVVLKSDGTNAVASLLTDDGTTLSYASGKFAVAAASGDTEIGGTLTAKGSTLTLGTATTTIHVTQLDTSQRPTLTNCGTGAAIVGNDSSWRLTTGTTAGACVVTFHQAYSANASCGVKEYDGVPRAISVSTTALTFTAVTDSTVYRGECEDH